MLICAGSWLIIIVGAGEEANKDGNVSNAQLKENDPYLSDVVAVDGKLENGYFTSTVPVYTGSTNNPNTLKITAAGAKALFGVETAAEAEGKYTVTYMGGLYRNGVTIADKDHFAVAAGTHYYKITDTTTGQVLYHKYAATIDPDDLTITATAYNATTKKDLFFVGDAVTFKMEWTPNNTATTQGTISYTYTVPNLTADFENPHTDKTKAYSVSIDADVLKNSGEVSNYTYFENNFTVGGTTGAYTVGAKAYIGSNYYGTLVRALNASASGNTVVAIPAATHELTTTTFTNAIDQTCDVKSGVKLLIPISTSTEDKVFARGTSWATVAKRENLVTITEGVKVNVYGTVNVSATISGGQGGAQLNSIVVGPYAEIIMEKGSEIYAANSGATINSYGFISSGVTSGTKPNITLETGATLTTLLTIIEHRGGTAFLNLCGVDTGGLGILGALGNLTPLTSPFNRFYTKSITSNVIVNDGATVNGFYDLYMNDSDITGTLPLFGKSSGFFLEMKDGSSVTYTYDTETNKNIAITKGNMAVNPIKITVSISGYSKDISTEKVYLPISHYWHIEFEPATAGGTATVSVPKQNVKILPGGYIKVHKGVTANLQSLAIYDNASVIPTAGGFNYTSTYKDGGGGTFIVDGTLNIAGGLGGIVLTEGDGAVVKATNVSTTSTELSATDAKAKVDVPLTARGPLIKTANYAPISTLAAGITYNSWDTGEVIGWYTKSTIKLNYSIDGVIITDKAQTFNPNGPYVVLKDYLYEPTYSDAAKAKHYTFSTWYTDAAFTEANKATETTKIFKDTTLYSKWIPNQYDLNLVKVGPDGAPGFGTGLTFNVGMLNVLDEHTPENADGYTFMGWYTDAACKNKITSIDGLSLINLNNGNTIYGKWIEGQVTQYKLNYSTSGGIYQNNFVWDKLPFDTIDELKDQTLPVMTTFDTDTTMPYTFDGWYLGETKITSISAMVDANEGVTEFNLVAKWKNKDYGIVVNSGNAGGNSNIQITEGKYYTNTFSDLETWLNTTKNYYNTAIAKDGDVTINRYFTGWNAGTYVITGNLAETNFTVGTHLTVTPTWGDKCKITITTSGSVASFSVTIGGTAYNSAKTIFVLPDTTITAGSASSSVGGSWGTASTIAISINGTQVASGSESWFNRKPSCSYSETHTITGETTISIVANK